MTTKKTTQLVSLIRYRFFLPAGVTPYILGLVIAYNATKTINLHIFLTGLFGIVMVLVGVETFNEYFDPSNRVFALNAEQAKPPRKVFWIGILTFSTAFLTGVYLTFTRGLAVIALAFMGFIAAAFYVGPPIRLAYRGFGETSIFLSYGPLMALGSYYIQTLRLNITPIFASLIPAMLILALAIANEIPDYYQDSLVGKMNIVVRVGQKNGALLYSFIMILCYSLTVFGLLLKTLPIPTLNTLITLPLTYKSIRKIVKNYDAPQKITPVIRNTAIIYIVTISIFVASYLGYGSFRIRQ